MVTFSTANLPTPKSWDEFEDICKDAFSLRWSNHDLSRHGRAGQKQDGVDIYGTDYLTKFVGIQCKNTVDGISESVINDEINKAQKFRPIIDALYIATTAPRDAKIQRYVRNISATRIANGLFPVDVVFWDDLTLDLSKDNAFVRKHYPVLFEQTEPTKEQLLRNRDLSNLKRLLLAIDLTSTLYCLEEDAKYVHSLLIDELENICKIYNSSVFTLHDKTLSSITDDMIQQWVYFNHLFFKAPYDYNNHNRTFFFKMPGDFCRNAEEDALFDIITNQMRTLKKSISSFCEFINSHYHEINLTETSREAREFYC